MAAPARSRCRLDPRGAAEEDRVLTQNIPLAIVLGIVGSFCFAMSAQVQHRAVGEEVEDNREKKAMSASGLLRLVKSPRWWAGASLLAASAVLQVLALMLAPVSVVQPVGLLAFPWSVILSSRKHGGGLPPRMLGAVTLTVVATLAFTVVASVSASPPRDFRISYVVMAAASVYLLAAFMVFMGSTGPLAWRCLFWASGGALFYGLEAALVKALIEYLPGQEMWWTEPLVYGIAGALIAGSVLAGLLIQQGYATGPAEVVVGSMTVTSPVVAVVFGIAVLGEGRTITPLTGAVMLVLGGFAILGVALMTRFHPHYIETTASGAVS